jgi:hypothetical protein
VHLDQCHYRAAALKRLDADYSQLDGIGDQDLIFDLIGKAELVGSSAARFRNERSDIRSLGASDRVHGGGLLLMEPRPGGMPVSFLLFFESVIGRPSRRMASGGRVFLASGRCAQIR